MLARSSRLNIIIANLFLWWALNFRCVHPKEKVTFRKKSMLVIVFLSSDGLPLINQNQMKAQASLRWWLSPMWHRRHTERCQALKIQSGESHLHRQRDRGEGEVEVKMVYLPSICFGCGSLWSKRCACDDCLIGGVVEYNSDCFRHDRGWCCAQYGQHPNEKCCYHGQRLSLIIIESNE